MVVESGGGLKERGFKRNLRPAKKLAMFIAQIKRFARTQLINRQRIRPVVIAQTVGQGRRGSCAGPYDFGGLAPSPGLILIKGLVTFERI